MDIEVWIFMAFPAIAYKMVFAAIRKHYEIFYPPPGFYRPAMRAVKRIFDDNFTVDQIVAALDEAKQRRRWPTGTSFWRRVHDILLVHRREHEPGGDKPLVDSGPTPIASLLQGLTKS